MQAHKMEVGTPSRKELEKLAILERTIELIREYGFYAENGREKTEDLTAASSRALSQLYDRAGRCTE